MRDRTPSRTARKIALNVVSLGSRPDAAEILPSGAADASARLLVAAGVVKERLVRVARSAWVRRLYDWLDRGMPGQFVGIGLRKLFCEREVRRALAAGASQVLVLGAGYDTLCWRLSAELPEVTFVEIDHPATARRKAAGVEALGTRPNLHLIAEDLGETALVEVLAAAPCWDASADSVVVAEGLLMYLSESAVRGLFTQLAAVSGSRSRVAFTHVGQRADGRPDAGPMTRLTLWSLERIGEPWLWSANPDQLDALLGACGWRRLDVADAIAHGGIEHFCVAGRA